MQFDLYKSEVLYLMPDFSLFLSCIHSIDALHFLVASEAPSLNRPFALSLLPDHHVSAIRSVGILLFLVLIFVKGPPVSYLVPTRVCAIVHLVLISNSSSFILNH